MRTHLVELALARRLELAHAWRAVCYAQAQQSLHPEMQAGSESIAGGYVVFAGRGSPVNRALALGLSDPVTHSEFAAFEQFFLDCATRPRIDLCPLADRSLLHWLQGAGYRLEQFHSVLFCPLSADLASRAASGGVQVHQVDAQEAALWIRTTAQGFDEQEIPSQQTLNILAPNFYSPNATCFLARIDGQPAGGGAMYVHSGVAEFGGESTRPGFRRLGVQRALLQARLVAALGQGCDLAMAIAEPGSGSERNMRRVGFLLAYTKAVLVGRTEE